MQMFLYNYNDESLRASAALMVDECLGGFRVKMNDEPEFTISPSGIPGPENKTIWVQSHKSGEKIWPHELVLALGEGIESAEINMII